MTSFALYYSLIVESHGADASEAELRRSFRPTLRQRLRALLAGLRRPSAAAGPNPDSRSRIPR